jgi:hypothetical protein
MANDEEMLNLVSTIKKNIVTHKEVKVNKKTNSNHEEKERIA